jgi:hypothetical protein
MGERVNKNRYASPLILDQKGINALRSRKYRSPIARGGSLDQSSPENKDPIKKLLKRLK